MNNVKLTIEELHLPDVAINGEKHCLFCEYTARDNIEHKVYVKDGGTDVVIVKNDEAIFGLFSLEDDSLNHLFDYLEASIRRSDDLTCFWEGVRSYLDQAKERGGNYPVLSIATQGQKHSAISTLFSRLGKAHFLSAYQNEIRSHTVPVEWPSNEKLTFVQFIQEDPKKQSEKDTPVFLGDFNISQIMREVTSNAWFGIGPQEAVLLAGEDKIRICGYLYEPFYEDFSATASISFNDQILYGLDSRNVAAYHNETYNTGTFDSLEKAIAYLQDVTKGKQIVAASDKKSTLSDLIKNAGTRSGTASEQNHSVKKEPHR